MFKHSLLLFSFMTFFYSIANAKNELYNYCTIEWTYSAGTGSEIGPDNEIAIEFVKQLGGKWSESRLKWSELFKKQPNNEDQTGQYTPYPLTNLCSFYAVSMTATADRARILNIIPFYAGRTMIVVRSNDRNKYSNIDTLKNTSTVVIKGTTYAQWLHDITIEHKNLNLKITELETGHTVEYLLKKKVDFVQLDTIQALYFMHKYPDKLSLAFPAGSSQRIGWAFKKGNSTLPKEFQNFISKQRVDPNSKLNAIFKKYYGVTLKEFDSLVFSSVQK